MKLRVWQAAIELYAGTSKVFGCFPYQLRRVSSQAIASADSVHRNIAEGYCRRGIREYLHHLNIALGSLGESVSGLHACKHAGQLTDVQFDELDSAAYALENGLVRLIGSLQKKKQDGTWKDSFIVKESNESYGADIPIPVFQHSHVPHPEGVPS